jgi:hypothetical protein
MENSHALSGRKGIAFNVIDVWKPSSRSSLPVTEGSLPAGVVPTWPRRELWLPCVGRLKFAE